MDRAETDEIKAYAVNKDGAANAARACKESGARLLHVSTDYVFGEGFKGPIPEDAPTEPLNVYGASKRAGEMEIAAILPQSSLIVRTSSLHGRFGANFVHTMLELFRAREEITVVSDQFMSPTWAGWLARVLLELAPRTSSVGIVHACSYGVISWFDFAQAILEEVEGALDRCPRLVRIRADQYPRPAKRAHYSAMSTERLTSWLQRSPIHWREGLRAHLRELGYAPAELVAEQS